MVILLNATTSSDHLDFLLVCHNLPEIRGDFQPCKDVSRERLQEIILGKSERQATTYYIVHDQQHNRHVGYAYACYEKRFDQYEVGVTLIPSVRNMGVGTTAHVKLTECLVQQHGARRLQAFTSTRNGSEIRVLEKCNFVREGTLRRVGFLNGYWHDLAIYAILLKE